MDTNALSGDFNFCEVCRKPLPRAYTDNVCPVCREQALFRDVKEFIRAHDVNEYDVAEHFNLPIQKVKGWIREGRIQYKDEHLNAQYLVMHCQGCGEQITFGTLCSKCMKKKNVSGKSVSAFESASGNMRHLTDYNN